MPFQAPLRSSQYAPPSEVVNVAVKKFSPGATELADFKETAKEAEKFADGWQIGVTDYFKHARGGK